MNDLLKGITDIAQQPVYIYSRADEEKQGAILLKKGISAEKIAKVEFLESKITSDALLYYRLGKKLLQPHESKGIQEPDFNANIKMIEQQNLFLSLFIDRLNNPWDSTEHNISSSFALEQSKTRRTSIIDYIGNEKYEELSAYDKCITALELKKNNGVGNYQDFLKITCLNENADLFRVALVDTIYLFERTMQMLAEQKKSPPQQKPDGFEGQR